MENFRLSRSVNTRYTLNLLFLWLSLCLVSLPAVHRCAGVVDVDRDVNINDSSVDSGARLNSTHPGSNSSDKSGSHNQVIKRETHPEMNSICPGAEYVLNQTSAELVYHDNRTHCETLAFPSLQGVVYGMCQGSSSSSFCLMHIQVPRDKVVHAKIRMPRRCGFKQWTVNLYDSFSRSPLSSPSSGVDYSITCQTEFYLMNRDRTRRFFSSGNRMYFSLYNKPQVDVRILEADRERVRVIFKTSYSGYVELVVKEGFNLGYLDQRKEVDVPAGHVISIEVLRRGTVGSCQAYVKIYREEKRKSPAMLIAVCHEHDIPVKQLNTSRVLINLSVPQSHTVRLDLYVFVFFAFHLGNETAPELVIGLFDCSQESLDDAHRQFCLTSPVCEDGRDEGQHCPSSSSTGCWHWVASHRKCLQFASVNEHITGKRAHEECRKSGGKLASFKTAEEWEDSEPLLRLYSKRFGFMHTGLSSGWYAVPFMYSQFRKWSDNTVIYGTSLAYLQEWYFPRRGAQFGVLQYSSEIRLEERQSKRIICELGSKTGESFSGQSVFITALRNTSSIVDQAQQLLIICPGGNLMHRFLLCDLKSHCGQSRFVSGYIFSNASEHSGKDEPNSPYQVAMFACDDGLTTVPHTLLCNFIQDCPDDGDESFCEHPPCEGFPCTNGQCVLTADRCNQYSDCVDDSDELGCPDRQGIPFTGSKDQQPFLLNLNGMGYFTQQKMNANDSCPDTHYRCTSGGLHCLPVYTRCNGLFDCIGQEDETGCEEATCLGFYRCRDSGVCVHADHLCDGWGQCPQRDDEWLCGVTCPPECVCQGWSFVCRQPLTADRFPHLRYLDAEGSGMTLHDVSHHPYLVRLSLPHCSITFLPFVLYPNLQFIDLSFNRLTNASVSVFLGLPNLRVLLLSGNPLTSLIKAMSNTTHNNLKRVGLSETSLVSFDSEIFENFPGIRSLNISSSGLQVIGHGGFQRTSQLSVLDLRGNRIISFPFDVFKKNTLSVVFSPNNRICCHEIFSKYSKKGSCFAPEYVLSSCENLLHSELYRVVFWSVTVMAVCGNCVCFIGQCAEKKKALENTFSICTINLQAANISMGVYTIIIAIANEKFRGSYLLFENNWTNSAVCKVAGFVSLLSSEVSVLIVWFIMVDRIIVLRVSSSRWRLNAGSASVVCGVTWLFGSLLASFPLLPELTKVGSYGQTALCHLAVFDQHRPRQDSALLHFIVVFNATLCLLIAGGELIIHRITPKFRIVANSSQRYVLSSQSLMVKVSVTTLVCWSSVTLSSLSRAAGVAVSEEIGVVVGVFVLPLSSALYPLCYGWSRLSSRRQEERERRLQQALKSRLALPKACTA